MLKTQRDKDICNRFRARRADGFTRCMDCPLVISKADRTCRAFMHYDRQKREWVRDEHRNAIQQ